MASYAALDEHGGGRNGTGCTGIPVASAASRSSRNGHCLAVSADDDHVLLKSITGGLPSTAVVKHSNSQLSEPLTAQHRHGHDDDASMDLERGKQLQLQQSQDPFDAFRQDLYRNMERVDESLAEYLRVVHQTDAAVNTHECKESRKALKRHWKQAESALQDVRVALQLTEQERAKFPHVDDAELYRRTALVNTSQDRLERAKQDMNSEAVKAKLLADERAKATRRAATGNNSSNNNNNLYNRNGGFDAQSDRQREHSAFLGDTQTRTAVLMQHQDATLDDLDVAVTRVGQMAGTIHEEIQQQGKMLDEMQDDLDEAEEQLGAVMSKLGHFLQTRDRFQLGTILTLFVVVVVLLFLVIYT